jgi:hypothetical protein
MSFFTWLNNGRASSHCRRSHNRPRSTRRLHVERLEDRTTPSSYSAATVSELIAAIDAANVNAEADTIVLASGKAFTLTGASLPTITAPEDLTIQGNGGVIERSAAGATPAFRLFNVAAGASLTLENLTLQGGWGNSGGAIFNQGALTLAGVTVQNNFAWGAGGGIFSNGSLTLANTKIQYNQAVGFDGDDYTGGNGGNAAGGGVYVAGGTATLTGATVSFNTAQGGNGGEGYSPHCHNRRGCDFADYYPPGNGGHGSGGGLAAAGGIISLHNTSVTRNTAKGGAAGGGSASPGIGAGGGLYFWTDALVCLDAFTVANVKRNRADINPNIAGAYTICA